jgi:hypothetical protein
MSIKELPHVTVEQVLALRKAAIDLERQLKSERIKLSTVYKHNAELRNELSDLKASLPKVRADAVRGLITAIEGAIENDYISMKEVEEMELEDFCNLSEKHADKMEAGNE